MAFTMTYEVQCSQFKIPLLNVIVCFVQVSQAYLNQQSGPAPSFPLDLLKSNSTPTLVTDSNGNHFLIALASHIIENQRTDAPESKATNQITLQVHDSLSAVHVFVYIW